MAQTTSLSPNMSLPVPVVGVDNGPQYGFDLNACFAILDAHNHSPGSGAPIATDGLNINADLPFNDNNATQLRSARFQVQGSLLSGISDLGAVYVSGVDLYYNDVNGVQIRLTQAGSPAGAAGTITGLVAPASVSYVGASQTFVFQSGVNIAAALDAASLIIRNFGVLSNGITVQAPAVLPSDYTLVLPPQTPSVLAALSSDNSGNLYWVNDYDAVVGSSAQVTAGMATHSTIASALSAVGADGIVKVLRGSFVENVTISSRVRLIGMGVASVVTGNLTFSGVDKAYVSGMSFSGDVTFDSSTTETLLIESYVALASVVADNGSGNYIQLTVG